MPPDQAPPHRLPDSGRASGGPPAGAGPRAEAGASPLPARLTPREREVLGLVAAGRSNAGIAAELVLSGSAVTKYVNAIFTKLDLRPDPSRNRRVQVVLAYLRETHSSAPPGRTAPER
ncbi:response regulator transcription factor [Nocardiopsis composta]|uniref:DNA-binding NarL/FixJ family response regulator n=1 Tax=Nocardiopsis composta TaxID=157465 RepID=A0A7W8QH74_9ACTN|nr:helix-turn-helix transcriptional regulator [Nocardiopsis composta]MBB5429974.1 DNA-binding NarL/FixJ family response regulator [Nocardiopsis composta]